MFEVLRVFCSCLFVAAAETTRTTPATTTTTSPTTEGMHCTVIDLHFTFMYNALGAVRRNSASDHQGIRVNQRIGPTRTLCRLLELGLRLGR